MYRKLLNLLVALIAVGILCSLFATPTFAASAQVLRPNYSDSYYSPNLSGSWVGFTDYNGVQSAYVYSNGSNTTAQASWWITVPQSDCQLWVYVPVGHATATIGYGLYYALAWGQIRDTVWSTNQNNDNGWVRLGGNSTLPTNIDEINLGNGDGQSGTQIGVGTTGTSLEVYCP